MHSDFGRLVLRLIYLFYNLVDLRIDFVEPVKRETPPTKKMEGRQVVTEVDVEGCPSAPEATSTKFINQCGLLFGQEFRSPQDYGK